MKIRIKGNSVRIRLSRTEVGTLAQTGCIEERTEFGDNDFVYALQSKAGIDGLEAGFAGHTMTMYIPAGLPQEWAGNETVGYSNHMPIAGGKELFLLLEKDFQCIDAAPGEDQSDNYTNPTKVC